MTKLFGKHILRTAFKIDCYLQPLTAVHIHSEDLQADLPGHGNIQYVNIFFMRRAKEVGLRKTVSAVRSQLAGQFLGETMPAFNLLAEKDLALDWSSGRIWLGFVGFAIVTGLLAGSYPALYLSGFQPVKVLKGSLKSFGGNLVFRNVLVVTQFVVSIVLLIGTVVVYQCAADQSRFGVDRGEMVDVFQVKIPSNEVTRKGK